MFLKSLSIFLLFNLTPLAIAQVRHEPAKLSFTINADDIGKKKHFELYIREYALVGDDGDPTTPCNEPQCREVTKKYIARKLDFIVRETALLPFETDEIQLTVGFDIDDVAVSFLGAHNQYSFEANYNFSTKTTVIEATSTSRILAPLTKEVVDYAELRKDSNGRPHAVIQFNEQMFFLQDDLNGSHLEVSYRVERQSWRNEVVFESQDNVIASKRYQVELPTRIFSRGQSYILSAYVKRIGSRYYDSNVVRAAVSKPIKF